MTNWTGVPFILRAGPAQKDLSGRRTWTSSSRLKGLLITERLTLAGAKRRMRPSWEWSGAEPVHPTG